MKILIYIAFITILIGCGNKDLSLYKDLVRIYESGSSTNNNSNNQSEATRYSTSTGGYITITKRISISIEEDENIEGMTNDNVYAYLMIKKTSNGVISWVIKRTTDFVNIENMCSIVDDGNYNGSINKWSEKFVVMTNTNRTNEKKVRIFDSTCIEEQSITIVDNDCVTSDTKYNYFIIDNILFLESNSKLKKYDLTNNGLELGCNENITIGTKSTSYTCNHDTNASWDRFNWGFSYGINSVWNLYEKSNYFPMLEENNILFKISSSMSGVGWVIIPSIISLDVTTYRILMVNIANDIILVKGRSDGSNKNYEVTFINITSF